MNRPAAPVHVVSAREVPLGGTFTARRTLPSRDRAFVGAWCFADHDGPVPVLAGGGMDVAPHPHTGLQTVSWLFSGELEHRDSAGNVAPVRPGRSSDGLAQRLRGLGRARPSGEVNLMTAGAGTAHSETSVAETGDLHGVQLWVAQPDARRHGERRFAHHEPPAVPLADAAGSARVFVGELAGVDASPVATFTPLLGAELTLVPDAALTLAVHPAFEHGVLLDNGAAHQRGQELVRVRGAATTRADRRPDHRHDASAGARRHHTRGATAQGASTTSASSNSTRLANLGPKGCPYRESGGV